MQRNLVKFKLKGSDVLVAYEQESEVAPVPDRITLESKEEPVDELREAMAGLSAHVVDICELPEEWEDELAVIGVTITDGEFKGVVFTALRSLDGSNSPLVINSPHFCEDSPDEGQMNVYTAATGEALDELERLVFEYVDGARKQKQGDLFDEAPNVAVG